MDMAEFLLFRMNEDEGAAHKLALTDRRPLLSTALTVNHPARIMAELAAKRAIFWHHWGDRDLYDGNEDLLCTICTETGPNAQAWPCETIKAIAAVYADHPDYKQDWKPRPN